MQRILGSKEQACTLAILYLIDQQKKHDYVLEKDVKNYISFYDTDGYHFTPEVVSETMEMLLKRKDILVRSEFSERKLVHDTYHSFNKTTQKNIEPSKN
jgi:hypothetical protein